MNPNQNKWEENEIMKERRKEGRKERRKEGKKGKEKDPSWPSAAMLEILEREPGFHLGKNGTFQIGGQVGRAGTACQPGSNALVERLFLDVLVVLDDGSISWTD